MSSERGGPAGGAGTMREEDGGTESRAVAGGALVVQQSQTKAVKLLLEDAGWLCKSPGHKISAHRPGLMLLPLTSQASGIILQRMASSGTAGAGGHPSGCASHAKLLSLIAGGSVEHIPSEALPLPPVPFLRQQTRKRKSLAVGDRQPNPKATAGVGGGTPGASSFVELFAGIGGFRLGMEAAGCRCVFASELDPEARQTYQDNFDGPEGHGSDNPVALAGDITRVHSRHIPSHDILTAGFPCQSFSSAGRQEGLSAAGSGHLFFHVVRVLLEKQPRAFLLENVKGLTTMDGGETFQTVLRLLRGAGYSVWHKLIDSAQLLPQTRVRVYIVGFREDVAPAAFDFPEMPTLGRQAAEVLQDLPRTNPFLLSAHQWSKVQSSQYYAKHPEARLLEPSGHAQTLQASYRSSYMLYSQFVRAAGDGEGIPRFFTPRECARLMGFPETFDIECSAPQASEAQDSHGPIYRQLGNAACPPVVAAVAARLVACLRSEPPAGDQLSPALQLVLDALPADARDRLSNRNQIAFGRLNML